MNYWMTLSVPAGSQEAADRFAEELAVLARIVVAPVRVVDVQAEPPQGSTVVGDMHEDTL